MSLILRAKRSRGASPRAASATLAPAAARVKAKCSPRPPDAPVTNAVTPCNEKRSSGFTEYHFLRSPLATTGSRGVWARALVVDRPPLLPDSIPSRDILGKLPPAPQAQGKSGPRHRLPSVAKYISSGF